MPWIERLEMFPKWLIGCGAVSFAGLVGYVDWLVGTEISLRLFYIPPIALVAWTSGAFWAVGLSLMITVIAAIEEASWAAGERLPLVELWEPSVRFAFFLAVSLLVLSLRNAIRRERRTARRDLLTELVNSRSLLESAEAELNRSRRTGRPLSVAFIDCDNFKAINDTRGHLAGDELLRAVAKTLSSSTRGYDIVARMGGDEFAILLPETAAEPAEVVLRRVQEQLTTLMQSQDWPVTFSIGVATFVEFPDTANELIQAADELMYNVKRDGKSGIKHAVVGADVYQR